MKKPNTYTLRIRGSHPSKLPLDRLALYLTEMARLLGDNEHVHLDRVGVGSAALQVWVETEVAADVAQRVSLAVRDSDEAESDALKALSMIDELLAQDGRSAELKDPDGVIIRPFTGRRQTAPAKDMLIDQESTVTGQVIKIGGRDDTIPLLLRDADGHEYRCTVKGTDLAREISAHYLGDPIEVAGKAKWRRSQDGVWTLENLLVTSWNEISTDWEAAHALMTQLASGWSEVADIEGRCAEIRKGH